MLPDERAVFTLVLDDAGEAILFDLLAHQPLGDEVFKVADRADVGRSVFVGTQTHAALPAGEVCHLVEDVGGVDLLAADGAELLFGVGLVIYDRIAAVRALPACQPVRTHVDGVAAGAVDLLAGEEARARLGVFPAVGAFDDEFRHWAFSYPFYPLRFLA